MYYLRKGKKLPLAEHDSLIFFHAFETRNPLRFVLCKYLFKYNYSIPTQLTSNKQDIHLNSWIPLC